MHFLTHRVLNSDVQQFRVVFNRCGGSEKKKKLLLAFVNGLAVLWIRRFFGSCNLISLRLTDAPSAVRSMTMVVTKMVYMSVIICLHKNVCIFCPTGQIIAKLFFPRTKICVSEILYPRTERGNHFSIC